MGAVREMVTPWDGWVRACVGGIGLLESTAVSVHNLARGAGFRGCREIVDAQVSWLQVSMTWRSRVDGTQQGRSLMRRNRVVAVSGVHDRFDG
ncbi:hypothetical protein CH286_08940 [Rhodococcus sp. WWJCD1]|nr:hypothetical protein CH286_08940 [Rhodococcus sp. WWJCD1]